MIRFDFENGESRLVKSKPDQTIIEVLNELLELEPELDIGGFIDYVDFDDFLPNEDDDLDSCI